MLYWLKYPFVRITPFVILGAVSSGLISIKISHWLMIISVFIFAYALLFVFGRSKFFSLQYVTGMMALTLVCLIVGLRRDVKGHYNSRYHFSNYSFSAFIATVESKSGFTEHNVKSLLRVKKVKTKKGWQRVFGKILLYSPAQYETIIDRGATLLFSQPISEILQPSNPDEFNYHEYLKRKNICGQLFLKHDNWMILGHEGASGSFLPFEYIREQGEDVLRKHLNPNAYAISLALLLGNRSEITTSLKTTYSQTGASHVLAISGLHVGILYGFLLIFFKRFRNTLLFSIFSILVLWCFAIISGLSPSVSRAALMFSLFSVATLMQRKAHPMNTLALSAFILLLIDPNLVFDVGFQLSHLAVLGILTVFPSLSGLLSSKYSLANKIWDLTAVSISAQVFTFPLIIYYFHGFPILFFVSNLVVIPAACLILVVGLIFLITAATLPKNILEGFSWILNHLIDAMNYAVGMIGRIPGSYQEHLFLSGGQVFLICIFAMSFIYFVLNKGRFAWGLAIATWVLLMTSFVAHQIRVNGSSRMVVFNVPRERVVDLYINGELFQLPGLNLDGESESSIFRTRNHRLASTRKSFIPETTPYVRIGKGLHLVSINKTLILVVEEGMELPRIHERDEPLEVDYLILSNNAIQKPEQLSKAFSIKMAVLDSSNDYFYITRMKHFFLKQNIQTYDVKDMGAFVTRL